MLCIENNTVTVILFMYNTIKNMITSIYSTNIDDDTSEKSDEKSDEKIERDSHETYKDILEKKQNEIVRLDTRDRQTRDICLTNAYKDIPKDHIEKIYSDHLMDSTRIVDEMNVDYEKSFKESTIHLRTLKDATQDLRDVVSIHIHSSQILPHVINKLTQHSKLRVLIINCDERVDMKLVSRLINLSVLYITGSFDQKVKKWPRSLQILRVPNSFTNTIKHLPKSMKLFLHGLFFSRILRKPPTYLIKKMQIVHNQRPLRGKVFKRDGQISLSLKTS